MSAPVDQPIRDRALDPTGSFIVQAPAGSGKTELLSCRILALLATVDEPESILAITFTRKAAAEMRQRVIDTLESAARGDTAESGHDRTRLELAQAALQRDAERNWRLLDNPQRLNLRTIDSLATQLAHRLPVVSALGAPLGVIEQAEGLYRQVAREFVDSSIEQLPTVLLTLGNRLDRAETLFASLLARRDQWKRHVSDFQTGEVDLDALRESLEASVAAVVEGHLRGLDASLPDALRQALPDRLQEAARLLARGQDRSPDALDEPFRHWATLEAMPGVAVADLPIWQAIASALLTGQGAVRKQLTRTQGFPAAKDASDYDCTADELKRHKSAMLELLSALDGAPRFVEQLAGVNALPEPGYSDEQWARLAEMLAALPTLLLGLQLAFARRGEVDFIEIAERALRALGPEQAPTDLGLSMDLSLRHLLVDEFQDTSQAQMRLFRRLVTDWSTNDGRTFFAVGDPMQSIYRFREGDVALFLTTREHGIGTLRPESLELSVNFRSSPPIVDWVNHCFDAVFPAQMDLEIGAVPYARSVAHRQLEGGVSLWPLIDPAPEAEAHCVVERVREALDTDPDGSIGILLRARTRAPLILEALRDAGLPYQSVDMDPLGSRPVVRDLLALCLALRSRHDRLHWLALLRAPGVGLRLTDLHGLIVDAPRQTPVLTLLTDAARRARLEASSQARVERFLTIMEPAVASAGRGRFVPWVEHCWLCLGGPSACREAFDLEAAERCLEILYRLEAEDRLWRHGELDQALAGLYAASDGESDGRIQVMTMHKAKGLEFDTVILPSLERRGGRDDSMLLNWFEYTTADGEEALLLAPLEAPGTAERAAARLVRHVRRAQKRCDDAETLRVLYVACTRARRRLHLLAGVTDDPKTDGLKAPTGDSLLGALWPALAPEFTAASQTSAPVACEPHEADADEAVPADGRRTTVEGNDGDRGVDDGAGDRAPPPLWRLPDQWQLPAVQRSRWRAADLAPPLAADALAFNWVGPLARDVGIVVHALLQAMAGSGQTEPELAIARQQLRNRGVRPDDLEEATARVRVALDNTLGDERGRWCLHAHREARSEWALSVPNATGIERVVIDRTFVDDSDCRWIVDFKTGTHHGGRLEAFLDEEVDRYRAQLDRYARIIRRIDARPVRVGLWFPMVRAWREWAPELGDDLAATEGGRRAD